MAANIVETRRGRLSTKQRSALSKDRGGHANIQAIGPTEAKALVLSRVLSFEQLKTLDAVGKYVSCAVHEEKPYRRFKNFFFLPRPATGSEPGSFFKLYCGYVKAVLEEDDVEGTFSDGASTMQRPGTNYFSREGVPARTVNPSRTLFN